MIKYIINKIGYTFLVIWGAVTLVFIIFNLGGDPVENLVSENTSEEIKQSVRRKFDLDLGIGQRYVLYMNKLSPISIHDDSNVESRIYFDSNRYSGISLFPFSSSRKLYLKVPYLGVSYLSERDVGGMIQEALPGTIILAITAILFALIFGLITGIYCAVKKDSFADHIITLFSVVGMSGPSFFVAIIVAWIGGWLWYSSINIAVLPIFIALFFGLISWFYNRKKGTKVSVAKFTFVGLISGIILHFILSDSYIFNPVLHLPGTGLAMNGSLIEVDVWKGQFYNYKNLILPALTLGIRPLAVIIQLTRSSMLDVLSQDYIRTARAKGLSFNRVILVHALKNALNPVITAVSGWFASLLAGAVFVEFVFGYKGLGMLTYSALEKDDLPVVMGAVIIIAFTFAMINFLVDVLYGVLDPRIRV